MSLWADIKEHLEHGKRLSELERVVAAVDKRTTEVELDCGDLYERCRNMLKKTARERARIEASTEAPNPEAADPRGGNGRLPQGGTLTERQKELQQQILRRRGGL